jgi:hypothetical protein
MECAGKNIADESNSTLSIFLATGALEQIYQVSADITLSHSRHLTLVSSMGCLCDLQ